MIEIIHKLLLYMLSNVKNNKNVIHTLQNNYVSK